jgi:hypothetical protein
MRGLKAWLLMLAMISVGCTTEVLTTRPEVLPQGDSGTDSQSERRVDSDAGPAPDSGTSVTGTVCTTPTSIDAGGGYVSSGCGCSTGQSTPNAVSCGPAELGASLCCADSNWPAGASTCVCMGWRCHVFSGGGCECGISYAGSAPSSCTGAVCCAAGSSCLCSENMPLPCSAYGYTQVAQCDVNALRASGNVACMAKVQVSTCR